MVLTAGVLIFVIFAALFFSPFLLLRADVLLLLFFWEISCLSWPVFIVYGGSFFQDLSSKTFDLKGKYTSTAVVGDFNEAPDLCMDRFTSKQSSRRCNTIINDFCNLLPLLHAYRFMHADAHCLAAVLPVWESSPQSGSFEFDCAGKYWLGRVEKMWVGLGSVWRFSSI